MSSSQSRSINLTSVQSIRKAVLLAFIVAGIAFVLVGGSRWPSGSFLHEAIEFIGLALIVLCICGRMICTLYIGGRKIEALVTDGPYSVVRNPLYLLSIVGAVGVGAQLGSITLAIITGVVVYLVFLLVILKEEQVLLSRFGVTYEAYLTRVPRLWPKFSLWRDIEKVEVNPRLVRVTALDASIFLLSIPIAEGFEYLHDTGFLPTLITLP
ncbi:MAG: isoprenylcysteine carboxylmethyltransferase family protein [Xanthobacteraceae bacterium]|nr:isoprenylcysteine carboxylmethyltransferase family protein [Xanthobacteraceae bacterium]